MFNIDISVNVLFVVPLVFIAALAGYSFRSRELKKKQAKIAMLRNEIFHNHAEILSLQKENVGLEARAGKATVITVKHVYAEEAKAI